MRSTTAASNVLRQRGGTSGWAVDNTSGNDIISATDAGAWTLGSVLLLLLLIIIINIIIIIIIIIINGLFLERQPLG